MIYTVTFNPAIDYVLWLDRLRPGKTNRAVGEVYAPGGKGINVSVVLKNLGIPSVALGFAAGFTGDTICTMLEARGIASDFIRIPGLSRVNVKIKADVETEINGRGPDVPEEAFAQLVQKLSRIPAGSVLVLAGSVPPSMPDNTYSRLLRALGRQDIRIVVDAAGELLLDALPFRPWLIKPNREELDETFGRHMRSTDEAFDHARELQKMGARNVIVSLGSRGAMMAAESGSYYQAAFEGKVIDTVGAGDSMVAGFIAARERGLADAEALRMAVAAGSASAFRQGLAEWADIRDLLGQDR